MTNVLPTRELYLPFTAQHFPGFRLKSQHSPFPWTCRCFARKHLDILEEISIDFIKVFRSISGALVVPTSTYRPSSTCAADPRVHCFGFLYGLDKRVVSILASQRLTCLSVRTWCYIEDVGNCRIERISNSLLCEREKQVATLFVPQLSRDTDDSWKHSKSS